MNTTCSLFAGIDVGKNRHALAVVDAAGRPVLSPRFFTNTREGFDKLLALLKQAAGDRPILIGMEATGHYWYPVHEFLRGQGHEAVVLNPLQTAQQARKAIRKSKTDKVDAHHIAMFVRSGEQRPALIPDDLAMTCRQLTRLWHALGAQRTRVKQLLGCRLDCVWPEFQTHLADPLCPTGQAILRAAPTPGDLLALPEPPLVEVVKKASRGRLGLEWVQQLRCSAQSTIGIRRGIEGMRLAILTLLDQLDATRPVRLQLEEHIRKLSERLPGYLLTLPGSGPLRMVSLFGELHPISTFASPSQLVAFAGLDPTVYQTGQYEAPRRFISKRGSPHLRYTLWMMASAAVKQEGDLRAYYLRRREGGLHHLSAVTAAAGKLCHIVWRIMTDQRDYDPESRPGKPGK